MFQRAASSFSSQQTGDTYDTMDFWTGFAALLRGNSRAFRYLSSETTSQFATNMLGNLESGGNYLCNSSGNSAPSVLGAGGSPCFGFWNQGNFYTPAGNQQLASWHWLSPTIHGLCTEFSVDFRHFSTKAIYNWLHGFHESLLCCCCQICGEGIARHQWKTWSTF